MRSTTSRSILPYARRFVERIERLEPSAGPYRIGGVELRTSIAHVHAVQTYGLHFDYDGLRVAYLPCGRFFDGLGRRLRALAPERVDHQRAALPRRDERRPSHVGRRAPRGRRACVRRSRSSSISERRCSRPIRSGSRRNSKTSWVCARSLRTTGSRSISIPRSRRLPVEIVRVAAGDVAAFYRANEREALRALYDFSVIWHEQVVRFRRDATAA